MSRDKQRPSWRKTRVAALLAILVTLAAWKFRPKPYDPMMWLGDYEELRHRLGNLYANLDWSVVSGGMNLRELNAETYHGLIYARSDEEAGRVLRGFVRSFHDPHMVLLPAAAPPLERPPSLDLLSRFTPPEKACAVLGYGDGAGDFAFTLDERVGFRRLPGANSFPAALLDAGGRRFGLLRIGSFAESDYSGACLREWPRFRQALPGTCEAACQNDFRVSVVGRLLRELVWRVRQLRQGGAGALLIDITGNGGGRAWHRAAAQLIAPGPLPPFRVALVKGPYTAEALQGDRQKVFHYLVTHRPTAADRAVLDQALCRLDDLIAEAEHTCGAGAIWAGEPWRPSCSRLTTRPLFGTGLFEEDPGADLPSWLASILYVDLVYPRVRSAWSGPVAILVDEGTASASELFAASLRFSAGAVLLGRHTASAGRGWILGRTPWTLTRSGMNLYLPDSVEYWPDGANAREGLEPDIRIPSVPRDHPDLTARWLVRTLPSVGFAPTGRQEPPGRRIPWCLPRSQRSAAAGTPFVRSPADTCATP